MRMTIQKDCGLLLGITVLVLLSTLPVSTVLARPLHTPEIQLLYAKLIYFRPSRYQRIWSPGKGVHKIPYSEAVALAVKFPLPQMNAIPRVTEPRLYIGNFEYRIAETGISSGMQVLEFHIFNWEEIPDGEPIILTAWPGGPSTEPEFFASVESPTFRHNMIVDDRWRVFSGFVKEGIADGFPVNTGPYAAVTVNGGGIYLSMETNQHGWFGLNHPNGIRLEAGEQYMVKVIVNGILVFSKTITQETSDYPIWHLEVESQEAVFYEISGYVYDEAGEPIPEVTLSIDKHRTTTTDKEGHYELSDIFAGTYTLTATKEGYTFAPVKVTGGNGQPVTIDLVEKKPTQCVLYAVHNKARKSKTQLLTVDLAAEELEITPLGWQPKKPQISLAVGNFDSDEQDEIVTAAQKGHNTITLLEFDGQTIRSFPTSLKGMLLATGDLDGDDKPEIVAASHSANHTSVYVYAADGKMLETI